MTHRPKPALLILGVLMLASCGGTGTGSTGASTTTTSTTTTPTTTTPTTTTPTTVASTKTATIRITQDQTDCCYTEGQISFLRLSNNQGVQLDRGYAPLAMNAVLAQLAVEPGTYTLESWQRPCVASCPDLDQQGQPVDDSALDLISWAPGAGCETSLPEKQPPSDVPDEVALREPYPTCGTDRGLEDLALMQSSEPLPNSKRRCFLEAQMNGQRAELESYEPNENLGPPHRLIYRSTGDGLVVFYQETPNSDKWLSYSCTGLEAAPTGYEFKTTGCTDTQPLN
jgi:hypothetical protein